MLMTETLSALSGDPERATYTEADDVTADMELPLFDDMDGARFFLFYLKR